MDEESLRTIFMENKMIQPKTDKENTAVPTKTEKPEQTENGRPLSKRRSRRRLPAW